MLSASILEKASMKKAARSRRELMADLPGPPEIKLSTSRAGLRHLMLSNLCQRDLC